MELYQKITKTPSNIYGTELCTENPFLKGPVLLCISAQSRLPKSVFGITKKGMQAARVRTTDDIGACFDVSNFPITFLSIVEDSSKENEELESLVVDYILPLVSKDNHTIPLEEAIKHLRNVNIITYCDGAKTYLRIESYLRKHLALVGYTDEAIKAIISSCAVLPIGTSLPFIINNESGNKNKFTINDTYATTFQFLDIKDEELEDDTFPEHLSNLITTPITDPFKEYSEILHEVEKTNPFPHHTELHKNHAIHYYIGSGEHSLKEYINPNSYISVSISLVLTQILENSLKNHNSSHFYPIDITKIKDSVDTMLKLSSQGQTPKELFSQLDKNLTYNNTPKLSQNEAIRKTTTEIENTKLSQVLALTKTTEKDIANLKDKINNLINSIKTNLDSFTQSTILNNFKIPNNIESKEETPNNTNKLTKAIQYQHTLESYYRELNEVLNNLIDLLLNNTSEKEFTLVLEKSNLTQYLSSYANKNINSQNNNNHKKKG